MRLSIFILLFSAFSVVASESYSQVAKLSMLMKNESIENVLKRIEDQSEYRFFYSGKIDTEKRVSVDLSNSGIREILNEILAGTNIDYRIVGRQVALFNKSEENSHFSPVQSRTIEGKVTTEAGEPIPGATVAVKGKTVGTVTDVDGHFSLLLPDDARTIVISFIGYENQEIIVGTNLYLKVTLKEQTFGVDEVVVIGYGSMAKRDITGAIISVSGEDLGTNPASNINTALQGKIPGMEIVSSSGEPGAGVSIKIRGASSINGSSEPLYIVDGVPIEGGNISSIDGDATFSSIANINPNDIESVEVLKDAASAAIYGSRAANGVIIITTKGGNKFESVKPTIAFSHTSSLVSISRKLDVMNSEQFRTAYIEARNNNGQLAEQPWVVNPHHPYYNQTTDWQDVIFRTAFQTKSDITIQGSSDSFSYGISMGYKNLQPVVIHTDYQQINLRTNFSYKLSKVISGGTKISYSDIDYTRILSSSSNNYSALRAALLTNPAFAPYDPLTGELTDWLGQKEMRNPLAVAKKVPISFIQNQIILNQFLQANFSKNLTLRVSVSANIGKVKQTSFQPKEFDSATPARDFGKFYQTDSRDFINENTLTYSRKFHKHKIGIVLGQSLQTDNDERIDLQGQGYIDSKITPIQSAAKFTQISRTESERAMLSFFGRANYDYNGRYLASFTFRRDGSSRFGSSNRFGNFPSVSLGWRFTDEPFLAALQKVLYDGKLRASAGVTGNQTISNYAWMGGYAAASSRYDGNVIIHHNDMTNTNLGWETTIQYNAGLDLNLFQNRIVFTADAYIKKSKDLLFDFPVGYYTGFTSIATNFGSVENRGLEFLIETINLKKKLNWKTSFNISLNRNKITKLPNNEDIIIGNFSLGRIGEPMGIFYAHRALGVYARDEDNVYVAPDGTIGQYRKGASTGEIFKGGDMIWDDIDGNGVIDDNDRVIIGNPNPKFIGGMNNSFRYKTFSLNFLLQWSYGNKVMNELRRTRNQMTFTGSLGQDALTRWRKQGDITDFPMIRYGDSMENFRASSFNMEDASFLRLKEVALSWSVPKKYLKRLFINDINVFISGNNLLTWSKYSGYDPEVNSSTNPFIQGVDSGSFPKSRSYNMGLTVRF
ncbi:MAG: SusC/RagA family TonB-linked outer membrane protein [Mangrovibacterium sp.]